MSLEKDVGEIKGMLDGVQRMIMQHHESVNRRIDDLHRVVTQRLDEHRAEIQAATNKADQALTQSATTTEAIDTLKKQVTRRSAVTGGGAAMIVQAGIELIKAVAKSS